MYSVGTANIGTVLLNCTVFWTQLNGENPSENSTPPGMLPWTPLGPRHWQPQTPRLPFGFLLIIFQCWQRCTSYGAYTIIYAISVVHTSPHHNHWYGIITCRYSSVHKVRSKLAANIVHDTRSKTTRSFATAKSTARPSCLVGVLYDIYQETNNRSTANQPLVRIWPCNLPNSAK